jgi:hypothetical protein
MSLRIDVASQISPELSALLARLVNDPDIDEPVTLGFVRKRVAGRTSGEQHAVEQLHFDVGETLVGEIDALIERYGAEAPAIDFVAAKASEELSRVFEAMMNDPNTPQRPTLGAVRSAMARGLVARLVGEGAIDPDEDETLLGEIEGLIRRFGEDAPAEELMRYE